MTTFTNSPSLSNQNIRIITRLRGPSNQLSKQLIQQESNIASLKSPNQKNKYQKKISSNHFIYNKQINLHSCHSQ